MCTDFLSKQVSKLLHGLRVGSQRSSCSAGVHSSVGCLESNRVVSSLGWLPEMSSPATSEIRAGWGEGLLCCHSDPRGSLQAVSGLRSTEFCKVSCYACPGIFYLWVFSSSDISLNWFPVDFFWNCPQINMFGFSLLFQPNLGFNCTLCFFHSQPSLSPLPQSSLYQSYLLGVLTNVVSISVL